MKCYSSLVLLLGLTAVAYAVKMKAPDADLETEDDAQTLEQLERRIEGALYQVSNTLEKAEQGQAGEAAQVEAGLNPMDYNTEVKWMDALFTGANVPASDPSRVLACAEVEDNYWMGLSPPVPYNSMPPSRIREAAQRSAADKATVKAKCALQGDQCEWCIAAPVAAAIAKDDGECMRPQDCKCTKREGYIVNKMEVAGTQAGCELLGEADTCKWMSISFGGMTEYMCMDKMDVKIQLEASCKEPYADADTEKNCQMWGWLLKVFGGKVGAVLMKVAVQVTKAVEVPIKAIGGQAAVDAFEGVLIRF